MNITREDSKNLNITREDAKNLNITREDSKNLNILRGDGRNDRVSVSGFEVEEVGNEGLLKHQPNMPVRQHGISLAPEKPREQPKTNN